MLELPSIIPLTPVTKLHKVLRNEDKTSDQRKKKPQPATPPQSQDEPTGHVDEMV